MIPAQSEYVNPSTKKHVQNKNRENADEKSKLEEPMRGNFGYPINTPSGDEFHNLEQDQAKGINTQGGIETIGSNPIGGITPISQGDQGAGRHGLANL